VAQSNPAVNAPNKPVHLMFLCGTIAAFYLSQWTVDWVWAYFGTPPSELSLTLGAAIFSIVGAVILYRNDRMYHLANDVATELGKVTWPTAKEVRAAALVVVVMTLLSAFIVGMFDLVWSNVTEFVYG
jgi:preprotein translocase subunit SecE